MRKKESPQRMCRDGFGDPDVPRPSQGFDEDSKFWVTPQAGETGLQVRQRVHSSSHDADNLRSLTARIDPNEWPSGATGVDATPSEHEHLPMRKPASHATERTGMNSGRSRCMRKHQ